MLKTKENFIYIVLGIFAYLIPFSARQIIDELTVLGTGVVNDFTRVFVFGIDLALIIALAIFLFHFLITEHKEKITLSQILMLVFVTWTMISFYLAPTQSALGSIAIIRLALATVLFLIVSKLEFKKSFAAASLGLMTAGVVQSLIAIQQFVLQKSVGLYAIGESPLEVGTAGVATFAFMGERILRAYGTLPHPNILAVFLAISLLATFFLLQKVQVQKFRTFLKIALALMSIGIVLTFSRLIIFFLAAVFAYLLVTKISKRSLKLGVTLLALIILTFVIFLRPVTSDNSYFLRKVYQQAAIEQIKKHPLTGVGIGQQVLTGGNELRSVLDNKVINYKDWMHQPVHNSYLLIATETGIIGPVIFLGFLVSLFAKSFMQKNKKLMVIIIAGLLVLATDHMFFTNPNILYLMFLLFGLAASRFLHQSAYTLEE